MSAELLLKLTDTLIDTFPEFLRLHLTVHVFCLHLNWYENDGLILYLIKFSKECGMA